MTTDIDLYALKSELLELKEDVNTERPAALARPREFSQYRSRLRSRLISLKNRSKQLVKQHPLLDLDFKIVELEIEQSSVPLRRIGNYHRQGIIAELAEDVFNGLQGLGSIETEIRVLQSGLAACINDPAKADIWIARMKGIITRTADDQAKHELAWNCIMVLASVGKYNLIPTFCDSLSAGFEKANALASLDFVQGDIEAGLTKFFGVYGRLTCPDGEWINYSSTLKDALLRDFPHKAILVLAYGIDGIYGVLLRSGRDPLYSLLVRFDDVDAFREQCMGVQWLYFAEGKRSISKQPESFTQRNYQAAEVLHERLIEPFPLDGITHCDLVVNGWLAAMPWNVLSAMLDECNHPHSNLPVFCLVTGLWSCMKRPVINLGEGSLFYIKGDQSELGSDEKSALREEERALRLTGFTVVEDRGEIRRAIENGDIVHFAGHGRIPNIGEVGAVLHFCLADGTEYTLDNFIEAQVAPPLVTLNSCQLGFAFHKDGDYVGLHGLLGLKGTRSFIAPLSWIKPTVSCPFFVRFYDSILKGNCVGDAYAEGLRTRECAPQGARNLGFWAPLALYGSQWLRFSGVRTERGS
jgi:hypothetical protein